MNKQLNVYGIQPVIELIDSEKQIDTIYLQKDINTSWSTKIKFLAREQNLNLKLVPKYKLNRITKKNHQGIVATTSSITFQNFENLLSIIFSQGKFPIFLLLDRVTDVRNFGSICRSAESFGVDGIIIPEKNSAQINEIAMKTSAGALSNLNICREKNLIKTVKTAKKYGLTIIACSEKSHKNICELNLTKPQIIIIGSEENGISQPLLKLAHEQGKIPTKGKTNSLNASVAAGIILFEHNRQVCS
ncbi:MAG: 23S rRNA (guanosine(2251)-2'-O)-methyltransferase RlmB [Flavobacteriales bacterium]|nr:23S rRNA (guanosine(2251)-2'-O)-methyltransferase RlmB [Flavobacteriales bacterium]|tara:strand:+ start:6688 stop:7425 length:738 start_codon:yes stop_codon:yes gene_type:complete